MTKLREIIKDLGCNENDGLHPGRRVNDAMPLFHPHEISENNTFHTPVVITLQLWHDTDMTRSCSYTQEVTCCARGRSSFGNSPSTSLWPTLHLWRHQNMLSLARLPWGTDGGQTGAGFTWFPLWHVWHGCVSHASRGSTQNIRLIHSHGEVNIVILTPSENIVFTRGTVIYFVIFHTSQFCLHIATPHIVLV